MQGLRIGDFIVYSADQRFLYGAVFFFPFECRCISGCLELPYAASICGVVEAFGFVGEADVGHSDCFLLNCQTWDTRGS